MANMTEAWLSNQGYVNIHMSEWNNDLSLDNLKQYCAKHYGETVIVPSGYLGEKDLLSQQVEDRDVEFITKENIKERAEIIFNRSKYANTRFRAGEVILRSFDPLNNFSSTKEVVLK
jgi:hypothetical protein